MVDDRFEAILRAVASAPSALDWTLRPGTMINDRWQVDAEIGRGGMGVVVRAHDSVLGRDVALKFLDAPPDDAAAAALLAEARAVAAISHPNIVNIFDVGQTHEGRPFMAMEYVEGRSLRAHLEQGSATPFDSKVTKLSQLAAALDAAWDQDLLHGDLKPENVLIDTSGTIKVLDFGLASSVANQAPVAGGTRLFMAPELFEGRPASAASDAFAFGAIIFEVLTGTPALTLPAPGRPPVVTAHLPASLSPEEKEWGDLALRLLSAGTEKRLGDCRRLTELLPRQQVDRRADGLVDSRRPRLVALVATLLIGGGGLAIQSATLQSPAVANATPSPALASLPSLDRSISLNSKFRVATEQWYAGDDLAALRSLEEVLAAAPNAPGPLLVRLFVGHFELDQFPRAAIVERLKTTGTKGSSLEDQAAALVGALNSLTSTTAVPSNEDRLVLENAKNFVTTHRHQPSAYFPTLMVALALGGRGSETAFATLEVLVSVDPTVVRPSLHLAWGHFRQGDSLKAQRALSRALRTHPKNLALLLVRGQFELGQSDLTQAAKTFDTVLQRDPAHLSATLDRAEVAFLRGDVQAWRRSIEAVATGPYPAALRGRGIALHARLPWSRGDFDLSHHIFSLGAKVLEDGGLWNERLRLAVDRSLWAFANERADERERVAQTLVPLARHAHVPPLVAVAFEQLAAFLRAPDAAVFDGDPAFSPVLAKFVSQTQLFGLVTLASSSKVPSQDVIAAVFQNDDTGPLQKDGLWHQEWKGRLALSTTPPITEAMIEKCLRSTHFDHLWCRAVVTRLRKQRATSGSPLSGPPPTSSR